MKCPECSRANVKDGALFCPSCTQSIFNKIESSYIPKLKSVDIECVLLGYGLILTEEWFELFRKRHGCERVFFRQKLSPFEELCQYIETTFLPSKGTSLHIVAQTKMTNIFLTFIQNHLRYGIL